MLTGRAPAMIRASAISSKILTLIFFCLQETKMQAGQLDLAFDGYESYWNYAEKRAIRVRLSLLSISQSPLLTASIRKSMTRRAE